MKLQLHRMVPRWNTEKSNKKNNRNQQERTKKKWESSGATEHYLKCHGQFIWLHTKALYREPNHRSRKTKESLEIKKLKINSTKTDLYWNEGHLIKTNTWTAFLRDINNLQKAFMIGRSRYRENQSSNYLSKNNFLYFCLLENGTD